MENSMSVAILFDGVHQRRGHIILNHTEKQREVCSHEGMRHEIKRLEAEGKITETDMIFLYANIPYT